MFKHYSHLGSDSEIVDRVHCLSPKERTFTMNTNHIIGHAVEKNPGLSLCDSSSSKTVSSSLWKPRPFTSLWERKKEEST